jgi:hypothetical protein
MYASAVCNVDIGGIGGAVGAAEECVMGGGGGAPVVIAPLEESEPAFLEL